MVEKLIYSSTNNVDVNYICSILKENDIAFIKKTEGAGDYLTIATGNSFNYSMMVFVCEEDYEKAYELIHTIKNDSQTIEIPNELKDVSEEDIKEMDKEAKKTKKYLKLFILFFIFFPILIAIILLVLNNILQN